MIWGVWKGIGIIPHADIPELQVSAWSKGHQACAVEGSVVCGPIQTQSAHPELDAADSKLLENNLGERLTA